MKTIENSLYPNAFLPNLVISHNLVLCLIPTEAFFSKKFIYRGIMPTQDIETVFQHNLTVVTSKSIVKWLCHVPPGLPRECTTSLVPFTHLVQHQFHENSVHHWRPIDFTLTRSRRRLIIYSFTCASMVIQFFWSIFWVKLKPFKHYEARQQYMYEFGEYWLQGTSLYNNILSIIHLVLPSYSKPSSKHERLYLPSATVWP